MCYICRYTVTLNRAILVPTAAIIQRSHPGNITERDNRSEISRRKISSDEKWRNASKILLMAYYRSGSSFLGQIFAQNAESFYWFEPLDSKELSTSKNMLRRINDTTLMETDFQLLSNDTLM